MQDREKKKLRKQLEAQAKQMESQDGTVLLESILSTCGALLRVAGTLAADTPGPASESVYANYLSMAQRITAFYDSSQAQTETAGAVPGTEALRAMLEYVQTQQKQAAARQEKADALQRQYAEISARNNSLEEQIEKQKREIGLQNDVEAGLKALLEEFAKERLDTQEKINRQKEENASLLSEVTAGKGELEKLETTCAELAGQRDSIAAGIARVQVEIQQIPREISQLLDQYKELEGYLGELQTAETECSLEQQELLRQEIERLTPVVEEYQVATDTLRNRLSSLEGQKIRYDREKRQLATNVTEVIQEAMTDLKSLLQEQESFLDETERTANALSQSILDCQKKRSEYSNWLDADETPLTAMMAIVGLPEGERLRETLDVGQISEVQTTFAQMRQHLEHLDQLLGRCAAAAQEDLKRIRQRANP